MRDSEASDPLVAPRRPAARRIDGRWVSSSEFEAAAELSRMARRFGLSRLGVDGFRLYAAYDTFRKITWQLHRVRTRNQISGSDRR